MTIALTATIAAQLVPVFFYGVDGTIDQLRLWRATLSASTPVLLNNSDAISVLAFFTKWLGDPAPAAIPALVTLLAWRCSFSGSSFAEATTRTPSCWKARCCLR